MSSILGQLVRNGEPEMADTSSYDISACITLKTEKKIPLIMNKFVEGDNDGGLFKDFRKDTKNDDAVVIEIVELMKTVDVQRDLEICINGMVTYFLSSKKHLVQIDNIVTKVLFELNKQKVAPVLPIAYGMINSLDIVRFKVPINPLKIEFVREHLKEIEYKGMREILKLVLVEKLDRGLKQHSQLEGHQVLQLLPLEKLTIELLDRYNNFYPSLFIITEVCRIYPTSAVHKLPRLSEKIRNVVASFRTLADVTTFIGRPWAYPVTALLTYSCLGNTWRFSEHGYRNSKTHLPYNTLFVAAQAYPLYMIMKQPKSQNCLNNVSNNKSKEKKIVMCDEMLDILIMEAMCATENTKKKVMSEEVQYNWRHIMHLCNYTIIHKYGSFPELLKILKEHFTSQSNFKKAKGELMWLILQCVSLSKRQFPKDEITEIFNILYPEDIVWSGSSKDAFDLVRFFVPAAIWMNMAKENNPPAILANSINYLKEHVSSGQDEGLLACCANAYCNDETVFNTEVCTQIMKKVNSLKGVYELPFKHQCPGSLEGLEMNFLDLLTASAKNQLFTYMLFHFVNASNSQQYPSPAIVESLVKILLSSDDIKSNNSPLYAFSTRCTSTSDRYSFIFFDILAYRFKNISWLTPPFMMFRLQLLGKTYELLPSLNSPASLKLPQYVLMEQIILRQIMTAPCFDVIPLIMLFKKVRLNLFLPTEKFGQELVLCPEVVKLIVTQFIMSIKLIADCDGTTNLHYHIDLIKEKFRFPECTAKWLPQCLKEVTIEQAMDIEDVNAMDRTADAEIHQLGTASTQPPCSPNALVILYKCAAQGIQVPMALYKMVKSMTIYELTVNLNRFVDYAVLKFKSATSENEIDQMMMVLNQIIFIRPGIPVERFLMALIVHPNDNKCIKLALILLHTFLSKGENNGLAQRLMYLYSYVPSTSSYFNYKSGDFFAKQGEYNRKHFDYTDPRMDGISENEINNELPVLMYYSNLAERLVPLVDFIFMRCFEVGVEGIVIDCLVKFFAPLYRYHPAPITSIYKMVFVLEKNFKSSDMVSFVKTVGKLLDDDRQPKYPFLTAEFIHNNHAEPAISICEEIVNRVSAACTYTHEPPEFVCHDWRLSEFPPAAQAVTSGCLELMVSPKSNKKIVEGLVGCMFLRPINRPYDRLNSIALILTHLPKHYQEYFYKIVEKSFDWPDLLSKGPDYMLSSFNIEAMQYRDDRMITLLALVHSFIQHACCDSLAHLCTFIQQNLASKVNNETQLIYFLRILAVYLSKVHDREESNKKEWSKAYLHLIITIYDMIPRILKSVSELKYEDLVCDLLYQFKYTVTGFSVTRETEEAISRFPKSMQCKLKFLQTQGVIDMSDRLNKSIPHASLIQVLHQWQVNVPSLAEYNAIKSEGRNPVAFHGAQSRLHTGIPMNPQMGIQVPLPQNMANQGAPIPPMGQTIIPEQPRINPQSSQPFPQGGSGYHPPIQGSLGMPSTMSSSAENAPGFPTHQINQNLPPQQFGRPPNLITGAHGQVHPGGQGQHGSVSGSTVSGAHFPSQMMPGGQYNQMGMRGTANMPPPYYSQELSVPHNVDTSNGTQNGPRHFGPNQMQTNPGQIPGGWPPQNMMVYQNQGSMPMNMPNQQMHGMAPFSQGPNRTN